jgi:outer membrane protein
MTIVTGGGMIRVDVVMRKVFGIGGLLIALLVVSGCAAGGAKIEGKIGVVDPARVLNETSSGKKAKDSLNVFSKNRQALIEMDEKELRRMEEDFGRQASVLTPTAKKEREDQFRRRVAEYQQKAGEMNREVQEKQKDVLEGFREKVGLVVGKVAKRLGLQVVMDRGKGGPTVYSDEGLDITGQVIDEFNREYP